jgi:hypothetical protein
MNKNKEEGSISKKGFAGAVAVTLIALFVGFFVYPNIIHQKGEVAPDAPADLSAEPLDGSANLTWTAPADGGSPITLYLVKYTKDGGGETIVDTKSTNPEYTLTGLNNGSTYVVSVVAKNLIGEGAYSSTVEFIPSSVSATAPDTVTGLAGVASNASVALSWSAPINNGGSPVTDYQIYYRVLDSGEEYATLKTGTPNKSYTLTSLTNDTVYEIAVSALNLVGESAISTPINVTPQAGISISTSPSVTTTVNSANITWVTSKSGSSQVSYGATDSLGYMTEEMNTTERVTGHSVDLTGLISCTIYVYKVTSYDAGGEYVSSTKGEFSTQCKGGAEVLTSSKDQATVDAGVTVQAKTSGKGISVVVPPAVVTDTSVTIQAMIVSKTETISNVSKPTGKTWVGESYVLNALENPTTEVTSFDKSVSVAIDYDNDDIAGLNPDTLKIWHYEDATGWRELTSCLTSATETGGTVTCQTTSFSVFGIFGESPSSSSSSGSSSTTGYLPPKVTTTPAATPVATPTTALPTETKNPADTLELPNTEKTNFTKNLWYGVDDLEVNLLQKFLNSKGFNVSDSGLGSIGQETNFFGPKTRDALIKFQEAYKLNILTPLGLNLGTGFFGPQTRNFINSLQK